MTSYLGSNDAYSCWNKHLLVQSANVSKLGVGQTYFPRPYSLTWTHLIPPPFRPVRIQTRPHTLTSQILLQHDRLAHPADLTYVQ
jgi:hypothetical protein